MTSSPVPVPGPPAPAAAHGRAGRNLLAATGVGLLLAALVLLTTLTARWTFIVLAGAALAIGVYEVAAAMADRGIRVAREIVVASLAAVGALVWFYGATAHASVIGATFLLAVFWRLRAGTDGYVRDVSATAFAIGYLPLMLGFVVQLLRPEDGGLRVVAFVVLTVGNDIGGYAAGVLFGRHPMAPTISPKKSWEGFAGSLTLQGILGVVLFTAMLDAAWWQGLISGVVLTVSATLGDFVESALKRDLGVKDLGSILPGHGGLMDRLDSLLPNAFVAWALFTLFLGS